MSIRKFSEREKKTIRFIVDSTERSHNFILANVYNDIFGHRDVAFKSANNGTLIFYKPTMQTINMDEMFEVEGLILETSLLIEYLQKNGLVYFINVESQNQLNSIGLNATDGKVAVTMDLDNKISDILLQSLNHRIYIGETLRSIVDNNFMSVEEQQLKEVLTQAKDIHTLADEAANQTAEVHQQTLEAVKQRKEAEKQTIYAGKQTKNSWIAIIISILAIACSIAVAKFITMDVKIVDQQYNKIDSLLNDNVVKTDSLRLYIKSYSNDIKSSIKPSVHKNKNSHL